MERDAKNIRLKLSVEKEGSFEFYDDGEAFNLVEMEKESILLKSKLIASLYHYRGFFIRN